METDASPESPTVARKTASPRSTRPTRDRVQQLYGRAEFGAAYTAAQLLHANEPTPEHLVLLKKTAFAAALALIETGKSTEFNKLMGEAAAIDAGNREWVVEQACLLARGGKLPDALMRVDEAARPRVLGHGVDRALRVQSKEFLPDELHAGYDSIVAAFGFYEAAKDDEARTALDAIGLRSPFLEWKVFLRGLLAHAANDSARAAENFARLDSQRLPHRLAAPYRTASGPVYEKLNSSGITGPLREIAKHLGREKPLKPALRAAEGVLPQLKQHVPELVPKLAACLYHAIIRQGAPTDLETYRKLFAPPADDPNFIRLHARIAEEIGECEVANRNWRKYEAWLATAPAGWPAELLQRVRAHIWNHMGQLHDRAREEADNPYGPPGRKSPEPTGPPPLECYQRAVALAPDWELAARDLFDELTEEDRLEDAEQVIRASLVHHPDSVQSALALADNLRWQKRLEESLEFRKRALAINPLDHEVKIQTAAGVVALARSLLFSGKADAAAACLDADRELLNPQLVSQSNALRSVIELKRGDRAAAEGFRELVRAKGHLADFFRIAVDSQLAKLKPADRKAADQAFAEALKLPPKPIELLNLLISYDIYREDELTYRGQKTQEKKFLDLVPQTLQSDANESEFEILGKVLVEKGLEKPAVKFLTSCINRFRKNPVFLFLRAEVAVESEESTWTIEGWLMTAKELAEQSKEARHRDVLPLINELLGRLPNPFSFLDALFKGKA